MKEKFSRAASALALLFVALCFSCCASSGVEPSKQTSPSLPEVHPLALLSGDLSIYAGVPVKYHQQLVSDILCAEINGLSNKDALSIVKQVNVFYAGLGTLKDRSWLEIAAQGSIPAVAQSAVFTQKNGWSRQSYTALSTKEALDKGYPNTFTYYRRNDTRFQVGLPSTRTIVVGRDLAPMYEQYAVRSPLQSTSYNDWVNLSSNGGEDIRFYITRPGQYLRNLLGSDILSSNEVFGTLRYKPDPANPSVYSKNYSLTFCLKCSSSRTAKTLFSALQLSFGLIGGDLSMYDDSTIQVSGLEVSEAKLIDLFTRDPITGKHFEVNADGTVTTTNR